MTMSVAVIGVGAMGKNHARVFADIPQVELRAVADQDANAVESVARRHGCRAYTDYRQLLDVIEPDVVSLAVPTALHLEVALNIIERGIHLLIEKPIASSIEDGKCLIQAAEKAGIKLMIGHIERFNPAIVALKEELRQNNLGQVFQIDAFRQGPFPVRIQDVGVTVDLAVHDLDVMRYITGDEIVRLYAEIGQRIHASHEDQLSALVHFNSGVNASLNINWLTPTKIRQLRVIGEGGMYQADYITQDLVYYENPVHENGTWDSIQILRGVSEGRMIRHVIRKQEPLRIELEGFLEAVYSNGEVPVSAKDGLRALALAEALIQSGVSHQVIAV